MILRAVAQPEISKIFDSRGKNLEKGGIYNNRANFLRRLANSLINIVHKRKDLLFGGCLNHFFRHFMFLISTKIKIFWVQRGATYFKKMLLKGEMAPRPPPPLATLLHYIGTFLEDEFISRK